MRTFTISCALSLAAICWSCTADTLGIAIPKARYSYQDKVVSDVPSDVTVDALCNVGEGVGSGGCEVYDELSGEVRSSYPKTFLVVQGWRCSFKVDGATTLRAYALCVEHMP